jgi:hypothetical protein
MLFVSPSPHYQISRIPFDTDFDSFDYEPLKESNKERKGNTRQLSSASMSSGPLQQEYSLTP